MTTQKTIKILILSPESSVRINLKEAIFRVIGKSTVFAAKDCQTGLKRIEREKDIAAIFIRSTIDAEVIEKFQKDVSRSAINYSPLYFVTLHTDHHLSDYVSDYYLNGIEGFLKEPFATDDVDEAIRLAVANRERQIDEKDKELEALQFMLRDGFSLIDEAALERHNQNGRGGGFAFRRMKRLKLRTREMKNKVEDEELTVILETELTEQLKKLDLSAFKKKNIKVPFAEHPGKILSDILVERSLSTDRLCELLQVDDELLLSLLEQKEKITPAIAKELARVIGNTESHWQSLQSDYDAYERYMKNG